MLHINLLTYKLGLFSVSVANLIFNNHTSLKQLGQYLQSIGFLAIKFYLEES